jgi:hypothetical protein
MKKFVLIVLSASLLLTACNFPGTQVDEVSAVAQQTVQAELTSLAETAPTETQAPVETEIPETAEATAEPATATEDAPPPTEGAQGCTDRADFVSDVSYPDGTDVEPGDSFTKTWRLRNNGSCTWTSSYSLVFDHGDAMNGPASVALAGAVPPGGTVDLSVDLQAPNSPGSYQGYWLLRNNSGVLFGIGAGGNTAFWVLIEVPEPTPTATATGLVFVPVIPLLPFFYHSSGEDQSLSDGACFDLDEGNQVSCALPSADFRYNYDTAFSGFPPVLKQYEYYDTRNGTAIAQYGNELPPKADCSSMVLSLGNLDMTSGKYYCYKTTGARYGWIHVLSAGLGSMSFDWGTYN